MYYSVDNANVFLRERIDSANRDLNKCQNKNIEKDMRLYKNNDDIYINLGEPLKKVPDLIELKSLNNKGYK